MSIDWEAIHRRLDTATAGIVGHLELNPEEIQRILKIRAQAAAQPRSQLDLTEHLEVLGFSLAGETYAIETRYIREVCRLKDLTSIPGTPSFIAGVMSLRGRILAIIDLRKFFDFPNRGLTELNRIIVLRSDHNELGLLVDAIDGVRLVAASALHTGLPTLTGHREKFLQGITAQMLIVLHGGNLLEDSTLKINEMLMH